MKHWYVLYVLLTFSIGMATLGGVAVVWSKTKETFLRYYLYLHLALTLAVFLRLFFLYLHTSLPGIPPSVIGVMEYIEDFIAKYAIMITVPLFFHEFFSFPHAKTRNVIVSGLVVITLLCDHGLRFWIQHAAFNRIGRVLDDAVLTAILLYAVTVGFYYSRQLDDPVKKTFTSRIVIFVGLCLPGIIDELWLHSIFPIPVFPILYSGVSIMFTMYLFRHVVSYTPSYAPSSPDVPGVSITRIVNKDLFAYYTISPREQEVVKLVLEGRSNQDIGARLYISLSTVKTHLRNIYQKVGVNSRYELMTRFTKTPEASE